MTELSETDVWFNLYRPLCTLIMHPTFCTHFALIEDKHKALIEHEWFFL